MCGRNYAVLLEADALLPLSFSPSLFALSDVSFNKRVKQESTATLREAVNHSKPEATIITYPFFRFEYAGFNKVCHTGHLKGETKAIVSLPRTKPGQSSPE